MMQVNEACYENLTREKVDRIVEGFKKGERPVPRAMGEN